MWWGCKTRILEVFFVLEQYPSLLLCPASSRRWVIDEEGGGCRNLLQSLCGKMWILVQHGTSIASLGLESLLDTSRPVSPASLVWEKLILASQKPILLLSSPISKGHLSTYCWQIRNGTWALIWRLATDSFERETKWERDCLVLYWRQISTERVEKNNRTVKRHLKTVLVF